MSRYRRIRATYWVPCSCRERDAGRAAARAPRIGHRRARCRAGAGRALRSAPVDLDLVFLGTSASAPDRLARSLGDAPPARWRSAPVDCGEGTQRQLLRSDAGLVDLEHVFLTHLHADHVLGLPGMLKTFALRGREVPITVYGPRGHGRRCCGALGIVIGRLTYPLEIEELGAGDGRRARRLPARDVRGRARAQRASATRCARTTVPAASTSPPPMRSVSRTAPSRGALQRGEAVSLDGGRVVRPEDVLGPPRRGRTIVLTGDTAPTRVGRGSGRRVPTSSSTRRRSSPTSETGRGRRITRPPRTRPASPARRASCSSRSRTSPPGTPGPRSRRRRARIFPSTVVPRDFDLIDVPLPERGPPELVERGGRRARRQDVGSEHMTELVQLAVAGSVAEAEELEALLDPRGDPGDARRSGRRAPGRARRRAGSPSRAGRRAGRRPGRDRGADRAGRPVPGLAATTRV